MKHIITKEVQKMQKLAGIPPNAQQEPQSKLSAVQQILQDLGDKTNQFDSIKNRSNFEELITKLDGLIKNVKAQDKAFIYRKLSYIKVK